MIMDVVKNSYARKAKVVVGSDKEYTMLWAPAAKGAKFFPGTHAFGSNNMLPNNFPISGVGEADSPRLWRKNKDLGYAGQCYGGEKEWYLHGVPQGEIGKSHLCAECRGKENLAFAVCRISSRPLHTISEASTAPVRLRVASALPADRNSTVRVFSRVDAFAPFFPRRKSALFAAVGVSAIPTAASSIASRMPAILGFFGDHKLFANIVSVCAASVKLRFSVRDKSLFRVAHLAIAGISSVSSVQSYYSSEHFALTRLASTRSLSVSVRSEIRAFLMQSSRPDTPGRLSSFVRALLNSDTGRIVSIGLVSICKSLLIEDNSRGISIGKESFCRLIANLRHLKGENTTIVSTPLAILRLISSSSVISQTSITSNVVAAIRIKDFSQTVLSKSKQVVVASVRTVVFHT